MEIAAKLSDLFGFTDSSLSVSLPLITVDRQPYTTVHAGLDLSPSSGADLVLYLNSLPSKNQFDGMTRTRHERFYLQDGNVILLVRVPLRFLSIHFINTRIIQVENVLFRIHKYIVSRDSQTFADMFTVPAPPDTAPEGSTDENPIELFEQSKADLECFLEIMYFPG